MLIESGFTGYIGAACGHDIDASLKMAIEQGIIPGPRIRACSKHIGTTGDVNDSKNVVAALRQPGHRRVRRRARRNAQHGARIRTPRCGDDQDLHQLGPRRAAVAGAAQHGARRDRGGGPAPRITRGARCVPMRATKEMIRECVELGVDIIDHGDEIDDEIIAMMATRALSGCRAWSIPRA